MHRYHLVALGLLLAVLAAWGAVMAIAIGAARLPDAATGKVLAVFAPSRSADETFSAVVAAGARPVRPVTDFIWVAQSDEAGLAGRLRAQGAKGVFGEFTFGPELAGCLVYIGSERRPRL